MRRRTQLAVVTLLGIGLLGSAPPAHAARLPAAPAGFTTAYATVNAAMRAAGRPYADWAASGRTFLAFDTGGDGTAVEVVGDLATADRIAVLVPGVDSTLENFDRGLDGVARRAPAVQARALYDQLRNQPGPARVAVVAWLGYDPPEGLGREAARQARARAGAAALTEWVRMLARHRPAATVTLIGHSYGAVVIGLAAPDLPPQVTALVTVGGVGMGADNVAGLRTRATVWAAQAPGDWIRWIPQVRVRDLGHGVRPADPAFGAHRLPVDGVTGHDDYLVPGTGTLRAVGLLVAGATGRADATVRADATGRAGGIVR